MCLDKKFGGLRVKDLGDLNKVLLAKWSWQFANEKGALWNDVVRVKFGEQEGGGGMGGVLVRLGRFMV